MKTMIFLASVFLAHTIHAGSNTSNEMDNKSEGSTTSSENQTLENQPLDPQTIDPSRPEETELNVFREHIRAWNRIQIKNVEYTDVRDVQRGDKEEKMVPSDSWSTPHGIKGPMELFKLLLKKTLLAEQELSDKDNAAGKRQQFKELLKELPKQLPRRNSFIKIHQEIIRRWKKVKILTPQFTW